MKKIYTAHSKHHYYAKQRVSAYVLEEGALPLNPFMNWDYFLDELVNRETIHRANEELIKMSDEVWQFGEISNGCYRELTMAMEQKMPIRFFTIGGRVSEIKPLDVDDLAFEAEIAAQIDTRGFIEKLRRSQI